MFSIHQSKPLLLVTKFMLYSWRVCIIVDYTGIFDIYTRILSDMELVKNWIDSR